MFLNFRGFAVAAVGFWLHTATLFAAQDGYVFARAPYLQFSTTNSIHVVWRTEGPVRGTVRFGETMGALRQTVSPRDIVVRASLGTNAQRVPERWVPLRTEQNLKLPKLHSAPVGTFQYEAKISGLRPDTKYFYAVYDGNVRLTPEHDSYSFTTPPVAGTREPLRFWVIGDGGTGRQQQKDVYNAMWKFIERDQRPLDFWIHVGDMAYGTGRDMEFQSRFFESYDLALRSSVCWPALGNHEGYTSKGTTGIGPYFDAYVVPKRGEAGGVPSGTEAYYSFDWGNIHFICLDSHDLDRKASGAMAKWLKADLEKANAEWLIAFWHHPPYTKGSHDAEKEKDLTEMRMHMMPIIESGGVDLVLTGHSHIYERSMLMDGAYATNIVADNVILDDGDGDPKGDGAYRKSEGIHPHHGTVQVVAGHAGQTVSRKGTCLVMRKILVEYGSVLVDVKGDTLTGTMLNSKGEVRDVFSIVKRGEVQPVRLPLPWQAPEYKRSTNAVAAAPPVDYEVLIPRAAEWQYLVGSHPQGQEWTRPEFEPAGWRVGAASFSARERKEGTAFSDADGKPTSLYIRREFPVAQADKVTELGLWMDYSDAYIAYINGREVGRSGVSRSSGRNAQKIKARDKRGMVYVALKDAHKFLRDGSNIIAVEVHAADDGRNLMIDPMLVLED
jgi:acid phosphatase type 7